MLYGQPKTESNFERTLFDEGQYEMTLTKAIVMMGKPTQFAPEGAPKVMMIWETEIDGEKFEFTDFVGLPKNLKWNEKSIFWKRIAEIFGITNNNDVAIKFGIGFGKLDSFIDSYDALIEHISTIGDNGKNERAEVARMTYASEDILGIKRTLILKQWDNGEKQGNEIAAIMGAKKAGGVRKPGAAKPGGLEVDQQPANQEGMPF